MYVTAAYGNYLPVYGDVLRRFVDSWEFVALVVTVAETVIGVLIVLGLFTRVAAFAGGLIALNLWLTFSFCDCWWNQADAPQVFWFYFSAMLLNFALVSEKQHISLVRIGRKSSSRPRNL